MAFPLLLLYLVLTFVRPAELYPGLVRFPMMEVASAAVLAATFLSVVAGRLSRPRVPQVLIVLAFAAWASFSVLITLRWFGGAWLAFSHLAPSLFLFYAVALNVDSTRRLRWIGIVLSALAVFLAGQAALAYHFGIGADSLVMHEGLVIHEGGVDLPEAREEEARRLGAEGRTVARVRSVGFLSDPNDLAQALVAMLPLLLALRRQLGCLGQALFVWAPAALIVHAVALTRSRGGLLAFAGVVFLSLRHRLGHVVSAVLGAAALGGLLFLGFVGGRSIAADESAMGRAWGAYHGIEMLRASPIWGVGFGLFAEHQSGYVAHNSFVHCFGELGLVGYFLWLALIVLTVSDLMATSVGQPEFGDPTEDGPGDEELYAGPEEEGDELAHWGRAALHALGAFLIGALFLSRTYNEMLFLLLGLGVSIAGQAGRRGWFLGSPSLLIWTLRIGLLEVASIVLTWVVARSLV